MAAPLTPLERSVYRYLLDYLAEHTFQPSLREIGRHFRIGSTKTVMEVLKRLERKGYIQRGAARSRGVRLIGYSGPLGTQPIPLYARAHAAPPTLRPEDIVRHYSLDRELLPGDDAFLARVVGNSAASHGVLDGDLAIVNPTGRAANEDLLALRIGEWIEVRAVTRQGSKLAIATERAEQVLGRGDDYAVLGAVAGIIREQNATTNDE